MLFQGYQNNIVLPDVNKELLTLKGYLDDEEAASSLAKFLRYNPSYAVELMTGKKLFPFQEMIIRGMFRKDFFLAIMGRGYSKTWTASMFAWLYAIMEPGSRIGIISKCLDENDYVITENGIKKIKEVFVGENILSRYGLNKILDKWDNILEKGLQVITKKGYSIRGKLGHQQLIYSPDFKQFLYKKIEDIELGDIIPIKTKNNIWGNLDLLKEFSYMEKGKLWATKPCDIKIDYDLYYLFGQILGDGCLFSNSGHSYCAITSEDEETRSFVENKFKKICPKSNIYINKNKRLTPQVVLRSNKFNQFLEHIGFKINVTSERKVIPSKILGSAKENIKYFLQGLYDSNGNIYIQKKRAYKSATITLNTSSYEIAKTLQIILLNFGIVSKLSVEKAKGKMFICGKECIGKKSYKVRITGYDNLLIFKESVGFKLKRKQELLTNYISQCKNLNGTKKVPIGNYLKQKYKIKGLRDNLTYLSLSKVKKLNHLDKLDNELIDNLIEEDFYFDVVTSVSETVSKTIDITVDKEKCYFSNGFISKNTFRQARFIFSNIEDFANGKGGELLSACFKSKPSHKNDIWEMEIGESKIVALPLGEGGKLRGFRFNVILIDELLLMPEDILNEVILPFIVVNFNPQIRKEVQQREDKAVSMGVMTNEERTVFSNPKFIGLSSASYKFEALYKLYQDYSNKILSENPTDADHQPIDSRGYGIIHLSYEVAPEHIYNKETLSKFKSQMSEAQFNREFGAIFTDDSGGFFSKRKMDACTIEAKKEPTIEIFGEQGFKYILAIDPSFSKASSSDHYAMGLFKLDEVKRKATLVHNYAVAGGQLQDHMKYFSYLLRYFNIIYVIIDNTGHWFIDECNASVIFAEHNLKLDFFDADFENKDFLVGLRNAKNSYNILGKKICHAQKFSSDWIRLANERLAAAFDHQTMWFASPAIGDKYNILKSADIPLEDLVYDNQGEELIGAAKKADFIEHQTDLIDLVKSETALIEIKSSSTGIQTFQLPQKLKRDDKPDRARRDNYTTLLLGNWAIKCYFDMTYTDTQEGMNFKPFFIR